MAKISKFVKLHKDILMEYVYNDGNLLSEPYNIIVNSRDQILSYVSADTTATGNKLVNQLFKLDSITNKFGKVNPSYYSFLQLKNYSSGIPVRHDTIKFHIPINWTFGEYLGFYIKVYTYDKQNRNTYELSNFYFDMTDISQQQELLNFTSPPLLFQEKLWGKNIQIEIPSISEVSAQITNNKPKENSINANLTNGDGLSSLSPIFIDFHFITNIQTINGITNYLLTTKITTTISQTPEFERLGLVIKESNNGDYFEIYGTYNDTIAEFKRFIDDSVNLGNRYYVQYSITLYEQNIRGKTTTYTVTDGFNETIDYRPIIKYSTTTAIIDVEMKLIDAVDESSIIRKASYGMLQDQVSKYSLSMTKINLKNAFKPKIYNIKNSIDPSMIGNINSQGMLGEFGGGFGSGGAGVDVNSNINSSSNLNNFGDGDGVWVRRGGFGTDGFDTDGFGSDGFGLDGFGSGGFGSGGFGSGAGGFGSGAGGRGIQTIKIPFPVLVERFKAIAKSENTSLNKDKFYGIGKLMINIFPFDNVISFNIAEGVETKPKYLNLTTYGEIKLVFKNDNNTVEFPLYIETQQVNLSIGQLVFRITAGKFGELKRMYESGINLFYITSTINNISNVIYAGLFKAFDAVDNVKTLNANVRDVMISEAMPSIIRDPKVGSSNETAIVTRKQTATPKTNTKPTDTKSSNTKPGNTTGTK
jgi:hypothetical protein